MRSDERYEVVIANHRLTGERRGGRWYFSCPSFPELAKRHDGDADTTHCTIDFQRLALLGGVTARSARED